ncbi:hypothetical protein DFH09DRAFT_1093358 [Mycena vulgaris]|nr:hypothetical protein DFH09DRAFT_1093358 [Mycena vulgaris]
MHYLERIPPDDDFDTADFSIIHDLSQLRKGWPNNISSRPSHARRRGPCTLHEIKDPPGGSRMETCLGFLRSLIHLGYLCRPLNLGSTQRVSKSPRPQFAVFYPSKAWHKLPATTLSIRRAGPASCQCSRFVLTTPWQTRVAASVASGAAVSASALASGLVSSAANLLSAIAPLRPSAPATKDEAGLTTDAEIAAPGWQTEYGMGTIDETTALTNESAGLMPTDGADETTGTAEERAPPTKLAAELAGTLTAAATDEKMRFAPSAEGKAGQRELRGEYQPGGGATENGRAPSKASDEQNLGCYVGFRRGWHFGRMVLISQRSIKLDWVPVDQTLESLDPSGQTVVSTFAIEEISVFSNLALDAVKDSRLLDSAPYSFQLEPRDRTVPYTGTAVILTDALSTPVISWTALRASRRRCLTILRVLMVSQLAWTGGEGGEGRIRNVGGRVGGDGSDEEIKQD